MSETVNNEYSISRSRPTPQTQLEKLHEDLQAKYASSVNQGLVDDLPPIQEAIIQVQSALDEVRLKQKITNSQAKIGNYRGVEATDEAEASDDNLTISSAEAQQIQHFNSVASIALRPGERFTSVDSHNHYMQTNISGLFSLMDSKQLA